MKLSFLGFFILLIFAPALAWAQGSQPVCVRDAPQGSPHHALCLQATPSGGVISFNPVNGAAPLPLQCDINGVTIDNCLSGGGVVQTKDLGGCPAIQSFGGASDGTSDNVAAWNTAIAAGARCLYFPQGKYRFNSQVSKTLTNANGTMSLVGDSPDLSVLYWPAGGGVLLTGQGSYTGFHVRDLHFTTSGSGIGTAFDMEQQVHNNNRSAGTFDRVKISGEPGDATGLTFNGWWAQGIHIYGFSSVNFNGLDIWGNYNLAFAGAANNTIDVNLDAPDTNLSFIYNFVNSNFYTGKWGVRYGPNVQGLTFSGCNFTLNWVGIYLPPDSRGQSQLSVVNSQFDNNSDNILLDGPGTGSSPQLFVMNNLFFLAPNTAGIRMKIPAAWWSFIGNQFGSTIGAQMSGVGIDIEAASGQNIIDSTVCVWIDQCVELGPNVTGVKVSNTRTDTWGTGLAVVNRSTSPYNIVSGFINPVYVGTEYPQGVVILSASAAPVTNWIRLEVTDTSWLTNGQLLFVSAPGIDNMPGLYKGDVVDATHIDLEASIYGGSYAGAGAGNAWELH